MSLFSLEQIFFQNKDPFKEDLINLIKQIYVDIDKGRVKTNFEIINLTTYGKDLVTLIRNRFNLNMVLDDKLSNSFSAAIIPFSSDYLLTAKNLNRFSPSFFSELFGATTIMTHLKRIEKEKTDIYKRINNRKGFVDFKGARVGGYLADVKHYLIINFFKLKKDNLTEEEIAAVITHEIGHAYDGLSAHYKMHTYNSAIMDTLNQLNENKIEKAIYTFKRHFDAKDLEEAKLSKDSQVTDFYGPLAKTYMRELSSQIKNSKYTDTNYETMADSFAVRFGFGKELVSGLDKIYSGQGLSPNSNKRFYYFLFIIDIIMLSVGLILGGTFGIILFSLIFIFLSGTHMKDMTYDLPFDRFNRIRNGIISNLKDRTLPTEYVEDLLNQILYIDSILESSKNLKNFKFILDFIADIVKPSAKEVHKYIEIQQTIENSLNNNLFLKSAQLRVF